MRFISGILFVLVIVFISSMTMQAERVVRYGYDATGNIVSRTLEVEEVEPTAMRSSQEEQEATTIENIDISYIKVYPNPVETFLNIEVGDTSAESLQIGIFTADGILDGPIGGLVSSSYFILDLFTNGFGTRN